MAIYEMTDAAMTRLSETTFAAAKVDERNDLQRLLRDDLTPLGEDALVIAEEFSDWDDSNRRIDLLAIDRDANLVVIELKRTERGGHMELQAIRYAAMVSTMTFEQAVTAYRGYLESRGGTGTDPEAAILDFLGWAEPQEDDFAQDVRIVLASADFSREITSAVLWLNERDLDIRCVRLKPYQSKGRLFVDAQVLIPLPEAAAYQVLVREKKQKERKSHGPDWTRYDVTLETECLTSLYKRRAIHAMVRHLCQAGVSPSQIDEVIHWRSNLWRWLDGERDPDDFATNLQSSQGAGSAEPRRWFLEDGELIVFDGKTYAFTNQWGGRAVEAMQALIDGFPEVEMSMQPSGST